MPFQAFLHINAPLIEFSFECGWLHFTWGWMYALSKGINTKSMAMLLFSENISALANFISDLDVADITACQSKFCKPMHTKLLEI